MRTIRFIGDVHGRFSQYRELIRDISESVQIGDMGVGFRRTQGPNVGDIYSNPPHYAMVQGRHRFIRGNHDNPAECKKHSQYIPDGTVEDEMMFVGGAESIDKMMRVEGYSWWPNEELSINELMTMVDIYLTTKPKIMVTHDCPYSIADMIAPQSHKANDQIGLRTRQAFQSMMEKHQPKLWIFGHWHIPFDRVVNGTRFICLPELAFIDVSF